MYVAYATMSIQGISLLKNYLMSIYAPYADSPKQLLGNNREIPKDTKEK